MIDARITPLFDFMRQNAVAVGIAVLSALLLLGTLLAALLFLLPQWTMRAELKRQIPAAEAALQAQAVQPPVDDVQARVAAAETTLMQRSGIFLSALQAGEIMSQWSDAAAVYGVTIVELQALPAPAAPQKPVYDRRAFRLTAAGTSSDLIAFVGALRAAALPIVDIENLQMAAPETAAAAALTMDLVLYTSPFAAAGPLPLDPVSAARDE